MNALSVLLKLGPVDLKNVRRDSLLVFLPLYAVLLALLVRWGVPPLTIFLRQQVAFDLEPFYPLLMGSFAILMPGMAGTVIGFLLLDERDDGIMSALLVTPLPPNAYLAYRFALPLALGFVMTLVTYPMAGLLPLAMADLALAALLGSFGAPFMALFLASFADNKVTGFAIMKLVNAVQVIPLLAYFVPMPWQLLVGINPSYWPMKVVWLAADGRAYAAYLVVGLAVNAVVVWLLARHFSRVLHR